MSSYFVYWSNVFEAALISSTYRQEWDDEFKPQCILQLGTWSFKEETSMHSYLHILYNELDGHKTITWASIER